MSAPLADRPVARAAAGTVRCAWVTKTRGWHQMLPGAGAAISVTVDGKARVYGPQTSTWWVNAPGASEAVGVDVRPGRLLGRLCGDVGELVGKELDLEDVLPAADCRGFVSAVLAYEDEDARVRAMQREAVRLLGPPDRRAAGLERAMRSDPAVNVRTLADDFAVSVRQLHRLCMRSFGVSPAMLRRLIRLERFLALTSGPRTGLAQMATVAGYFDQQHLARDCRLLADRTPAQLLASC